jgi:GNAT superfamily N-acetyltransferase
MTAIPLRRRTQGDMDADAPILRAALDDRLPWLAGHRTPEENRDFPNRVVFPQSLLWGAGDPARTGLLALRDGWTDQLHVLPGYQRRGIGSALLDRAKTAAPALRLWTFQRNRAARDFYARHGFRLGEETGCARNEEREPDALYLREAAP